MRYPQLVVYETERWIADLVYGTAGTWKWTLREVRQPDACLRVLHQGGPSVMVLELGAGKQQDLELLENITRLCPETATVVVSHSPESNLVGLIWDLGATVVLCPPYVREALLVIVQRLMETARPESGPPGPAADV